MPILDTVKNYSAAAWASPTAFRNLFAKPIDLLGKWCDYQGLGDYYGVKFISDMTCFKDMIGALNHLRDPMALLSPWDKSLGGDSIEMVVTNIAKISGTCFKHWELFTYLKGAKFFTINESYEKYVNWYGTVGGGVFSLANLKLEWSKIKDDTTWVPDNNKFSWVRVARDASALGLTALYSPLIKKGEYKLAKVAVATVFVVAGAVNAYYNPDLLKPKQN